MELRRNFKSSKFIDIAECRCNDNVTLYLRFRVLTADGVGELPVSW